MRFRSHWTLLVGLPVAFPAPLSQVRDDLTARDLATRSLAESGHRHQLGELEGLQSRGDLMAKDLWIRQARADLRITKVGVSLLTRLGGGTPAPVRQLGQILLQDGVLSAVVRRDAPEASEA